MPIIECMALFRNVAGILGLLLFVSSCGRSDGVAKVRFEAVSNSNRIDRTGRSVAANSQEMNLPKNYCYFIHVQGDDYYLKKDNKAKTCNVEGPLGLALMVGRTGGMDRLRNGLPPDNVQVFSPASYGDTLALEIKTSGAQRTFDIIGFDPKIFGLNATDTSPCSGELTMKYIDGLGDNDTQMSYRYGGKDRPEPTDKTADGFHLMARGSAVLSTSGDTVIPMVTKDDAKGVYPKYDGNCPNNNDTTSPVTPVPATPVAHLAVMGPIGLYPTRYATDTASTWTGVVNTPLKISCGDAVSVRGWLVNGKYSTTETAGPDDTATESFSATCVSGMTTIPKQVLFDAGIYNGSNSWQFNYANIRPAKLILKSFSASGGVVESIGSNTNPALIHYGSRYMAVRTNSHSNAANATHDIPAYTGLGTNSVQFVGYDQSNATNELSKRRLVVALTNSPDSTQVSNFDIHGFQTKTDAASATSGPFDYIASDSTSFSASYSIPALIRWAGGALGFLGTYMDTVTQKTYFAAGAYIGSVPSTFTGNLPTNASLESGLTGNKFGVTAIATDLWALAGSSYLNSPATASYPYLVVPKLGGAVHSPTNTFQRVNFAISSLSGYVIVRLKAIKDTGSNPVFTAVAADPTGTHANRFALVARCSDVDCTAPIDTYVYTSSSVIDAEPIKVAGNVHLMILTSGTTTDLVDLNIPTIGTMGATSDIVVKHLSDVALFSPDYVGFKPNFIRALDVNSTEMLIGGYFDEQTSVYIPGPGLLRSPDSGQHWLQVHTEVTSNTPMPPTQFVDAITVDNYESFIDNSTGSTVQSSKKAFAVLKKTNDSKYEILSQDSSGY